MNFSQLKEMRNAAKEREAAYEANKNRVWPDIFKAVEGTKYDIKFITDLNEDVDAPQALIVSEHSIYRNDIKQGRTAKNNAAIGERDLIAELYSATKEKLYAPKHNVIVSLIAHDLTTGNIDPFVWRRNYNSPEIGAMIDFVEDEDGDGTLTSGFYRLVRNGSGLNTTYTISDSKSVKPFDYSDVEPWDVNDAVSYIPFEGQLAFYRAVILPDHIELAESIASGEDYVASNKGGEEESSSEWNFD